MPTGLTPSGRKKVFAEIWRMLGEHDDHPWKQVGRCVYCGTCGVRLFQGRVPPGHRALPGG